MASLRYLKASPFVQMSPEVSRNRNDNGCLRADPQCEENPSFSSFKSQRTESTMVMHGRKICVFLLRCSTGSLNYRKISGIWELTIKMMACSITILFSITLTSVLWALWYFQGPSDPWPLTPSGPDYTREQQTLQHHDLFPSWWHT